MRAQTVVVAAGLWLALSPGHGQPGAPAGELLASPPATARARLALDGAALHALGVRVDHVDAAWGVPRFLTTTSREAGSARPEGGLARTALAHLEAVAPLYRLGAADLESVEVRAVHEAGPGARIARLGQRVGGVEVFGQELRVVSDAQGALVAISGTLAPGDVLHTAEAVLPPSLAAEDAVMLAYLDVTGQVLGSRELQAAGARGDFQVFTLATEAPQPTTWALVQPARAKRVWFPTAVTLELAWYVEVEVAEPGSTDSRAQALVVAGDDGRVLQRINLVAADAYSYRVWADPASFLPWDGPQGVDATPHPTGTPNGYQAPFVPPNLVTLQNLPFSRNDPWLPPNATESRGNNVEAYADLAAPDGYQPGQDLRAITTAPRVFDRTFDVTRDPAATSPQRQASVTSLFYATNALHDWFYDVGFDEPAGNAQSSNYGRGGDEGDPLKAEAQDYSGRNTSNTSTPADGASPRMQLYLFTGVPALRVNAPAALAGVVDSGSSSFGASVFNLTADLSIPNPAGITLACTAFPAGTFTGKIALVDRGTCSFAMKAGNAQAAGALGVVLADNAVAAAPPGLGGTDPSITVPVMSITLATATAWKTEVRTNGSTVNLTLKRTSDLDRDGALDNSLVAHEWAHYLTNRLVGNAAGLTNHQGRALGEGWSDFVALLLMVRDEDRNRPGNNQFQGVYAVGSYVTAGGANNGYYYGSRRVPYSTAFTKNALTFKHLALGEALPTTAPMTVTTSFNAEVHNAGEVWAEMLWECYASLLNAYPFQEAQNRMKAYLVASLKATPLNPTVLEARDALLAVVRAADAADQARFIQAFAKRGAGLGAKAPSRDAVDHVGVVESYVSGNNLEVVSSRLDDSVTPCDADGILDQGETGRLTLTVRNTGLGALSAFSGTVSASGATATVQFPAGNVLSFPALAAGASATSSVQVRLTAVTGSTPRSGLTVSFGEPSLPTAARTWTVDRRVHADLGSASTDAVWGEPMSWVSTSLQGTNAWRVEGTEPNAYLHADDVAALSDTTLESPWFHVLPTGNAVLTYKYRHSLEATEGVAPFWDGAVLELSTDGITWLDLFADLGRNPGYAAFLSAGDNPLAERAALVGASATFPGWSTATVNFGTLLAGQDVKLRFRLGTDAAAGAYGLDVDDIQLTNLSTTPFSALVAEPSNGTTCNRRPLAVARAPSAVTEGDLVNGTLVRRQVTLDGTGSLDLDGQSLSYAWTQVAGTPVSLTGATTATPSFTLDVSHDQVLAFTLVVNDGVDSSAPARVQFTVTNVNQVPVAVASVPATAVERSADMVVLDGTASSDADGDALTYTWTQVGGDIPVTLSSGTGWRVGFAPPEVPADSPLTFQLLVNDGFTNSLPSQVTVTIINVDRPPVADAGTDQATAGRVAVTLHGTASDPDVEPLQVAWTQVGGPMVALQGADTLTPSFLAPDVKTPAVLSFQLQVTSHGVSVTDTVDVSVQADQPPAAGAGQDLTVAGRTAVVLRGTAADPERDALVLAWVQRSGPAVSLQAADTLTPSFVSPDVKAAADVVLALVVTANGLTAEDTVTVSVLPDGAPSAHAGGDVTVSGRTLVVLHGSGTDPENDVLAFTWTQLDGPAVALQAADTAAPTFTSPNVNVETSVVFGLTVTANGLTATDSVEVHVLPDTPPTVNAGADQSVAGRTLVLLRATAGDADGDEPSFAWTQTAGATVVLDHADTATPSFTAPDIKLVAVLSFQVTVTANGLSAQDSVDVSVAADQAPSVDAGADRTAGAGTVVVLRAVAMDPEADPVAFQWTQVEGAAVTLADAETAAAWFTAPPGDAAQTLVFQVSATANTLLATDRVTVTVQPVGMPVVDAGTDQEVPGRTLVVLRGSLTAPVGAAATYLWTQTQGPAVVLTGADSAVASFASPDLKTRTELSFELAATAEGGVARDSVVVAVLPDGAPVADAGDDQAAIPGTTVHLRGHGTDPEADALTYAWTQTAGPTVNLADSTSAAPSFVAPEVTGQAVLQFQLVVSANGLSSAPDTVAVTVDHVNGRPVAQVSADQEVNPGDSVELSGAGSTDPEGDALTFRWTQVGGPDVTLTGAGTDHATFTAPEDAVVLSFQLVVTDAGGLASPAATTRVSVRHVNHAPVAALRKVAGEAGGDLVTLDGSGSTDADGDALHFSWRQVSGPALTLTGDTSAVVAFRAPASEAAQSFTLELSVTDGHGGQDAQQLQVDLVAGGVAPPADDGDGGSSSSTCGCNASRNPGDVPAWAVALLAVLGVLRRRART